MTFVLLAILCTSNAQCTSDYRGRFSTLQECVTAGEALRNVSEFICHPYKDEAGEPI
jgi:hypothetical protein